ncbi:MAG: phosphate acyltransferase PlsX [Candidatus Eremiobacteraeota bacterium]|nr:phosphate acyltransferase PlsX [Candidatus Eremiobacteraeota bacterium]MBC5826484.1 phosphate acyltransferase PlsX [Candidatus Eremiobacteraeota bacterium]
MGGDRAPEEIVAGSLRAAEALHCRILLVGDSRRIGTLVARHPARGRIDVIDAGETVAMDEAPAAALRRGTATSMGKTIELLRDQTADAAFSAGNSGALLALATIRLRTVAGIARPAIATVWPARKGPLLLLDAGANVDCRPEWIAQFAIMGTAYAQGVLAIARPKVGLLSIGEEEKKGNALTEAAFALLSRAPIRFVGNVEGRDLLLGDVDVVVCDGFVGNVALKVAEGAAEYLFSSMRALAMASLRGKLGAAILRPMMGALRAKMDYREYGGAPLLGVRGVCLIGHGRTDALAVENACRTAARAIGQDVVGAIGGMVAESVASPSL